MFTYVQKYPKMLLNGRPILGAPLYSGHGAGLNNPALEATPNIGPIPAGLWRIVQWFDTYENKGPCVAQLDPVGWDALGRSGFLIHGVRVGDQNDSSDGCICAGLAIRTAMRNSADMALTVISGLDPVGGTIS